jgi:tripeptidyl-peptidase-1
VQQVCGSLPLRLSRTSAFACTRSLPALTGTFQYVTIVGGTTGIAPETGAGLSSGGFSNYFPTASFQTSQVKAYLTSIGTQYSGKYNASGRGFPDVAAQAESVAIYNEGSATPVDGTSCSSPIFASVVGLLNDLLIKAGKSPLGWMNPFIYAK